MTMFVDPKGEDKCCDFLKMMVEEFGPEYVKVCVPRTWGSYCEGQALGRVALELSTDHTIEIIVNYENQKRIRVWDLTNESVIAKA